MTMPSVRSRPALYAIEFQSFMELAQPPLPPPPTDSPPMKPLRRKSLEPSTFQRREIETEEFAVYEERQQRKVPRYIFIPK